MSDQSRLDDALAVIKEEAEKAEAKDRQASAIFEAAKTGYAETPTEGEASGEYFDAVRSRVVQACFAYWNEHRKPLGLRVLVELTLKGIKADKREGGWSFGTPSELTVRRRANEAASKDFAQRSQSQQMLVCLGRSHGDSLYLPNPIHFQDEAQAEILKLAGESDKASVGGSGSPDPRPGGKNPS